MRRSKYSESLKDKARALVAGGMNYKQAAAATGTTPTTVSRWVDPKIDAAIRERQSRLYENYRPPQDKLDAAPLMAAIPPDTRSLSERLCGEPLHGRRAIDRMRAGT